jgi:aspartyl-tRNA(Asn)/glutamyl-tRNA(Gln) amidotransferase subunit C
MAEQTRVTLEDVEHVAQLANLHLSTDEIPRMQADLNAILGHIDELNELDTEGVPPMAQVSELLAGKLGGAQDGKGSALRPDRIAPSIDRAAVMSSAPETDGRFFKVPKVIER